MGACEGPGHRFGHRMASLFRGDDPPCQLAAMAVVPTVVPVPAGVLDQRGAVPTAAFQRPQVLGLPVPMCMGCVPCPCGVSRLLQRCILPTARIPHAACTCDRDRWPLMPT